MLIQDGQVTVNGEVETRRGRKLYDGDVFEFEGDEVRIVNKYMGGLHVCRID